MQKYYSNGRYAFDCRSWWHNNIKKNNGENSYLRGGSDRSFLEFIQILGNEFGINNKIIFVDSSSGEVERPSTKKLV